MAAGRKTGGRKAGTPNKATQAIGGKSITQLAQELAPQALQTLAEVMRSASSDNARVSAANSILDRAYGKPKEVTPDAGGEAQSLTISISAAEPVGEIRVTRSDS
jgi:hypothetical protein